jgi:hypothetical protein
MLRASLIDISVNQDARHLLQFVGRDNIIVDDKFARYSCIIFAASAKVKVASEWFLKRS